MTLRSKNENVNERVSFEIDGQESSMSSPEKAIRQLAYHLEKKYGVPREAQVKWIQADIEVREAQE